MSRGLPQFISDPDPDLYRHGSYVVLDFETTNLDRGDPLNHDNRIVLAVWWVVENGEVTGKWKFGHELELKELVDDIKSVDFLVAHNTKFELQWLARCGLDLRSVVVYDTQIAEYVLLGNRKRPLKLDSVGRHYRLGGKDTVVSKMMEAGVCPSEIPQKWLLTYCMRDVKLTHDIMQLQLTKLSDKLLKILYTRCLVTPCLADIETNGAYLDADRVIAEKEKAETKLAEIEEELDKLSGGINVNSTHQLAKWLYEDLKFKEVKRFGKVQRNAPNKQFPDGMPKTDADTLSLLKASNKKQRKAIELILERNKVAASLSKNLLFFYHVCKDHDGRFNPKFNQTVTVTHRLSASGRPIEVVEDGKTKNRSCQFQNFPRDMKPLFMAYGEGRLLGENDGSQLEFRTAGHLGRDEQIKLDVENDEDIHQVTANTLTEEGEPTSRQDAKASTFRPLFAGKSGTPAVQKYCEFFRQKYNGIFTEQLRWGQQAVDKGYVETEWGMRFYFPYTRPLQDGTFSNFTNISNYPIQSFASAEIVLISLVCFWHLSVDYDFRIINTIHDSIITDFPEENLQEYMELSARSMLVEAPRYLKTHYGIDLFVPLGCGIKVGRHWNEPIDLTDHTPKSICGFESKLDGGVEVKLDMHRRLDV